MNNRDMKKYLLGAVIGFLIAKFVPTKDLLGI
jgi:hypothetical protein